MSSVFFETAVRSDFGTVGLGRARVNAIDWDTWGHVVVKHVSIGRSERLVEDEDAPKHE